MEAIAPLVQLLLEIGITSPEAESLLRGLYVHTCRDWLAHQSGAAPSDVRVALVTGVHRNFVKRLLAAPPGIAPARERKAHRATRLLQAWYSDLPYLDGSGKPRDLPERGAAPSFEALAAQYVPGVTPAALLQELHRAGAVELLAEQRVRVRSRSVRGEGITAANIKELNRRARALLRTLTYNMRNPRQPLLCESLPSIAVDASRIPVIREVINRRASGFLKGLEEELAMEKRRAARVGSQRSTLISLTVFQSESNINSNEDGSSGKKN